MQLAANHAASACMDLSDGLADGVRQIAAASHVGITLDGQALPIRDEVREWHEARGIDPVMASLAGGDDYELLFTVPRARGGRLRGARRGMGDLPVTRIGVVTKDPRMSIRIHGGERDIPEGYEHFQ
jgi:thiamine-monophosphate kinase